MENYIERGPIEIPLIEPMTAERKVENGTPVLYLNGKRTAPMIYALSDVPISNPLTAQAQKNIANFAAQGIDIVSTDVNLYKGWHKSGPYRPDFLIGDLTAIIESNPNAAVILRLHVNAPYWWMRDNPDELCIYGVGGVPYIDDGEYERMIDGDEKNWMRVSLASEKWKAEAGEALKALLDGVLGTPQGRHIVGIQVAGGVYGEWHQWGFTYQPDYSKPMDEYFRNYLREKYGTDEALRKAWKDDSASIETAVQASPEQRWHFGGSPYRNPEDSAYVVDSLMALQQCVPDAILHFAKIVRETFDRPILIGTFYGYYDSWKQIYIGGHLETNRLFKAGLIDYISAPFHYHKEMRQIDGTGCARGLLETTRLNGVLWLTEMDNPPIGSPKVVGGEPEHRNQSVALLRRNILEPFTRGMGAWFFDHRLVLDLGYKTTIYIKKGWWDHPFMLSQVKNLKEIAEHTAKNYYKPDAEVLVVFDTLSRYYSNAKDPFYERNCTLIFNALGKAGVTYDSVNFDDMALADLSQYKCVIFAHCPYLTAERRKFVTEKLACKNRHLIFVNTAGYLDDNICDEAHITELCGIELQKTEASSAMRISVGEKEYNVSAFEDYSVNFTPCDKAAETVGYFEGTDIPAAAKKQQDGYTSWYFSVFPSSNDALREIFRDAGVHIYSENGEALLAGNGIVVVCTDCDRDVTVKLKNGVVINEKLAAMTTAVYDSITGKRLDI